MSQVTLATHLHEAQTFISKCERGERRLDFIEVRNWCHALGVNMTAFLERFDANLASDSSKSRIVGKRPRKTVRIAKEQTERD